MARNSFLVNGAELHFQLVDFLEIVPAVQPRPCPGVNIEVQKAVRQINRRKLVLESNLSV